MVGQSLKFIWYSFKLLPRIKFYNCYSRIVGLYDYPYKIVGYVKKVKILVTGPVCPRGLQEV
jgi:hypothetical protein